MWWSPLSRMEISTEGSNGLEERSNSVGLAHDTAEMMGTSLSAGTMLGCSCGIRGGIGVYAQEGTAGMGEGYMFGAAGEGVGDND